MTDDPIVLGPTREAVLGTSAEEAPNFFLAAMQNLLLDAVPADSFAPTKNEEKKLATVLGIFDHGLLVAERHQAGGLPHPGCRFTVHPWREVNVEVLHNGKTEKEWIARAVITLGREARYEVESMNDPKIDWITKLLAAKAGF